MEEKNSGWGLAVTTIILGTIVGTSSLLLSVLLDLTEHVFLHFRESNLVPVDISAGPGRRFLSVLVGGIVAAIIWYFLQRKYHPVSIAKALDGKTMPLG